MNFSRTWQSRSLAGGNPYLQVPRTADAEGLWELCKHWYPVLPRGHRRGTAVTSSPEGDVGWPCTFGVITQPERYLDKGECTAIGSSVAPLRGFVLAGLLLLRGWPGTRAGIVKAQPPRLGRPGLCNIGGETSKFICFIFPGILYFLLQSYDFGA